MALGWGQFFGGIGKIIDKIPVQGRIERWKNELENLKREKENLLKGACDEKKAERVVVIDSRIDYLVQLLKNQSGD